MNYEMFREKYRDWSGTYGGCGGFYDWVLAHTASERLSPAEREVIEAAKAWHSRVSPVIYSAEGRRMGDAIAKLPKPPPTLAERLRCEAERVAREQNTHRADLMAEAAARIEELEGQRGD